MKDKVSSDKQFGLVIIAGVAYKPQEARELAHAILLEADKADPQLKRLSRIHWVCGACNILLHEGKGEGEEDLYRLRDKGSFECLGDAESLEEAYQVAKSYSREA
jgi:hypothetical protein